MQNRLRRSKLELRGSRSSLRIGPRSSRGMRSAWLLALIPNLTTQGVVVGVPMGFRRGFRGDSEGGSE
eukprot:5399440-Alexandrium_andersonii.AAC.1